MQNLFDSLVSWISSSSAAAFSFGFNVIALLLSIWGFGIYFKQKKDYRLLSGMLTEYDITQKVEKKKIIVEKEHQELTDKLKNAEEDLKIKLPIEAKKAFYENMIPTIQRQIFDLTIQLNAMLIELKGCGDSSELKSEEILNILSNEVKKNMTIKRDIEKSQMFLAIYTGSSAAISIILPYPINLAALPIAFLTINEAFKLFKNIKVIYPKKAS